MTGILNDLELMLESRKTAEADSSYVASLYQAGLNKILEKVGEEAFEVVIAAKDFGGGLDNGSDSGPDTGPDSGSDSKEARQALIVEVADLWFHSLVMLSHLNLSHQEVLAVLEDRFGLSGHEEKAARNRHNAPA